MNWTPVKIQDFRGISKSTVEPPLSTFEELLNLDMRGKSGALEVRKGYALKYNPPSHPSLSNVEDLVFKPFYVSNHGGREITLYIQKATLSAETSSGVTPSSINMLCFWIRPYWNGTNWIDAWHWLNETILTKVVGINQEYDSVNYQQLLALYHQSSANNQFKQWAVLHYDNADTDYETPDDYDTITYSYDDGYHIVNLTNTSNSWVVGERVILMRNYFPIDYLMNMYSVEKKDIVFHNILDELRIGFGGYENRLGISICFREKTFDILYSSSLEIAFYPTIADRNTIDRIILDPYNTTGSVYNVVTANVAGGAYPGSKKYFYKLTAVLDNFNEFVVYEGDETPEAGENIRFNVEFRFGTFNKRITHLRFYISEEDNTYATIATNPFYFIREFNIVDYDGSGNTYNAGYYRYTWIITYPDFEAASITLTDQLGYPSTTDYVKSWDKALVIQKKAYLLNPYRDQRYANRIFFSVENQGIYMYDVIATNFFDSDSFDGDDIKAIKTMPSDNIGTWTGNKFRQIDKDTGVDTGLGVINIGVASEQGAVNLGRRVCWVGENDVHSIVGWDVGNLSEGSIRSDYRAIADKSLIIATREELDNTFRFYDGTKYEYVFTERGWAKQERVLKPSQFEHDSTGNLWFMSSGKIYYETGYTDLDSAGVPDSIEFIAKTTPINVMLNNKQLDYSDRFIVGHIHAKLSYVPPGTKLRLYKDGVQYGEYSLISADTDFFRKILFFGSCKEIQLELRGNTTQNFELYEFGFNYKMKKLPRKYV